MTKKRIAALQRIIDREKLYNETHKRDEGAGVHPSGEKFAITDGHVLVLYKEPVPDLSEASRNDFFAEYLAKFHREDRTILVQNPPTEDECRRVIQDWRKGDGKGVPRITISTPTEDGGTISSCFDARPVLDALEAMGPYTSLFIGNDARQSFQYPCLVVYPRLGRESFHGLDYENEALVLPCRPLG